MPTQIPVVTVADVEKTRDFLKGKITRTPVRPCPSAFSIEGCEIFCKFENEQLTGSFKIRGALNRLNALTADERKHGVVASSAGNHAQGVAYGAKALGIKAHIVMPLTTPIVKINATKSYGAEVILHGEVYDDAFQYAKKLEKEKGYIFVHPFEDAKVIAGQGTIGLELLQDLPGLESIIVPIGGGGLISGIALVAKSLKPSIRVIGVVSNQATGMQSLFRHQPLEKNQHAVATIAEGIAVKNPSPAMFDGFISKYVDEIVSVDDNQIAQAIVFLMEKAKTITEGAGAAGFAALMSHGTSLKLGKQTCVILCGGNIDMTVMSKVIERGLRNEHRLARLAVVADDLPGNLNRITNVMAESRANILEVHHDRVSPELALRETRIDLLVETASDEHIAQIKSALQAKGFRILGS